MILKEKVTGILYVMTEGEGAVETGGTSLTPLLDVDGKPMTAKKYIELSNIENGDDIFEKFGM